MHWLSKDGPARWWMLWNWMISSGDYLGLAWWVYQLCFHLVIRFFSLFFLENARLKSSHPIGDVSL